MIPVSKLGSATGELYEVGQGAACDSVCFQGLLWDCGKVGQGQCLLNMVLAPGSAGGKERIHCW